VKHEFDAEIRLLEGKIKWSAIYFPHSARDHFATGGRVNVKALLDGHEFNGVLLPSRNGHYLVYNAAMRSAVGKRLGDTVSVVLQKRDEKRVAVAPDHMRTALEEAGAIVEFLAMPAYMQREEIGRIESAKRDETRATRLQALIDKLAMRASQSAAQ